MLKFEKKEIRKEIEMLKSDHEKILNNILTKNNLDLELQKKEQELIKQELSESRKKINDNKKLHEGQLNNKLDEIKEKEKLLQENKHKYNKSLNKCNLLNEKYNEYEKQ